jgi:colanic acid/amylovoran biosynthesis glycosyltransferase
MKILFCTNTFENVVNGPAKFANYLLEINRLNTDAEIRILTEDISINSLHPEKDHTFRLPLTLNRFTKPWGFIYRMFPYYQACLKIQRSFPFDVVIFNNAITGIWSAIQLKTPVLGMINDDNSILVSLDNFQLSRKWFRHFIFRFMEKRACRFMEGIIVNSCYLQELVLKQYKPASSKLHLLYKGVTVHGAPDFSRMDFKSSISVLFVKSDFIRGGLFDLITALGLLPEYNFELQIVGPDLQFKEKILHHNKFSNVNIHLIGPASQSMVRNLMQQNDLFIVPSRQEAFGVANIEALINGLPVISTNVGGIPEVLNHGKNGWMANPGKPDELASIIRYVIQNPPERLAKQKNGYEFTVQNFSQAAVLNRFLAIAKIYGL